MKTAFITGASKGIGFACAKRFIESGYSVIITARNEDKLKAAKQTLGKQCEYIVWDASDTKKASEVLEKAHAFFGDISIFVNNAGIVHDEDSGASYVDFLYKTESAWDQTMAVNLKGVFFTCQAQAKYMITHGIKGNIVNICSEMGFRPAANAYGISKWGIRAMTEGMATNLAKYGIVVNGVAPGETATEILRQAENEVKEIESPRGVQATPNEIADSVYFMATSRNIIGEILVSDGGRRLK